MKKKIALIFGITGQDGSYLASFLLNKNYIVHGVKRRSSSINTNRIDHIYQDPHVKNRNLILHYGDVTDTLSVSSIIKKVQPHEVYNLAAQSHVSVSFEVPEYTANADAVGALRILESILFQNWKIKQNFIKQELLRCLEKLQRSHKVKKQSFIQEVLMELQKFMLTGSRLIIGRLIIFLLAMEFYLTMKVQSEVKHL